MTAGRPAAIFFRKAPAKSRGVSADSARWRIAAGLTARLASATSAALTASILSRISGTRQLLSELDERVQLRARRSALEQIECPFHSVLERRRLPADVDRGARVQGHDVAGGPACVLKSRDDDFARLFHGRNAQGPGIVHRQPEPLRVNEVLADLAVLQLPDHRLSADRDFVEAF